MLFEGIPLSFVIAYTIKEVMRLIKIELPLSILVKIPHDVYTYFCFNKDFDYKHVVDEHVINKRLGFEPQGYEVDVDVGANIGNFTLYATKRSRIVIAIEQNKDILRYLYTLIVQHATD